jgi:CheY-like chemotaxis protein
VSANIRYAREQHIPGRILVVEDSIDLREALELLASTQGCEVRSTGDAETALRILEEWPPDLILLDIALQNFNGVELLRRYRLRPGPQAAAIVVTGRPIDDLNSLVALGVVGVLPKPFEVNDLLDLTSDVVDCAKAA